MKMASKVKTTSEWWQQKEQRQLRLPKNENDLKNSDDLHIAEKHTALDIFKFAVFFTLDSGLVYTMYIILIRAGQ